MHKHQDESTNFFVPALLLVAIAVIFTMFDSQDSRIVTGANAAVTLNTNTRATCTYFDDIESYITNPAFNFMTGNEYCKYRKYTYAAFVDSFTQRQLREGSDGTCTGDIQVDWITASIIFSGDTDLSSEVIPMKCSTQTSSVYAQPERGDIQIHEGLEGVFCCKG